MRMASATGVRGVGIVSMLARSEELTAAGAVETAASVAEWVDRILGTSGIDRATSSSHAAGGHP
jgi:hypothetical protein